MIAQIEPSRHAGGGKAQYNLAREWRALGHAVDLFGVRSFKKHCIEKKWCLESDGIDTVFEKFLKVGASAYDIIDFDHGIFLQNDFELPNTLVVARSVLFKGHWETIHYPESPRLLSKVKRMLQSPFKQRALNVKVQRLKNSLKRVDLLNLTSYLDVQRAKEMGLQEASLCCFPYAIDPKDAERLATTQLPTQWEAPHFVFLGSFDFRKGCLDLSAAFHQIRQQFPDARLSLLGAKGLHVTESAVRYYFAKEDQSSVEVHMQFDPNNITELLSGKHCALFPSYREGFPFSVQETLAAGIPTIAYKSPGAADILPDEWLIEPGNVDGLVSASIECFKKSSQEDRALARSLVSRFQWSGISAETIELYEQKLKLKREAK
ncbi:MAG: glycosyltransferase family 4 protein [Opitutaceae bacterium]